MKGDNGDRWIELADSRGGMAAKQDDDLAELERERSELAWQRFEAF